MLIGVPKEIKNHEYRVGLTPSSVRELVEHGHKVQVETMAGAGVGFADEDYIAAGATIAGAASDIRRKLSMSSSAPASCCLPICIWPRTPIRPPVWSNPA